MLLPREVDLARRTQVTVEEMQQALSNDYSAVKTTATTTNAIMGGLAGAGLGVLSGVALASGILPNLETIASFGPTLPAMLGMCMTGVGAIAGSFVDLTPVLNVWRNR